MNPPIHTHIFDSPYHHWELEDLGGTDDMVYLSVTRSRTGKRKEPKCVSAMTAVWGLNPDTAYGQWIKALCTSGDAFADWVKSFNKAYASKDVTIFFAAPGRTLASPNPMILVCTRGTYDGPVHVSRTNPKEFRVCEVEF
jgi:hypothetical protein